MNITALKQEIEKTGLALHIETDKAKIARYNTNVFLKIGKRTLPLYEKLSDIPVLKNGEQFTILKTALPEDVRNWNKVEAYTHILSPIPVGGQRGQLLPPWWLIGLIILTVLTVTVFIGTYLHMKAADLRCGTSPHISEISKCTKIITAPDCSVLLYDACKNEKIGDWEEPKPPTPPPPPIVEIIKWLAIGATAVGGIYLTIKFLLPKAKSFYHRHTK